MIGSACARELSLRGLRVTLVERDHLASGASGRNHGLLITPTEPALADMHRESLEVYRDVAATSPLPLRLDESTFGFLIVAVDESEREFARQEAEAVAASGVAIERFVGEGLRVLEPALSPELIEGWLLQDGRVIEPAALTVAMALQAAQAGTEIVLGTPVRAILRDGERATGVVTDAGPISSETVVVAAGPWSGSLLRPLGVHLPIRPARGWLVHVGPAPGLLRHIVEAGGWHRLPEAEPLGEVKTAQFAEGGPPAFTGTLMHATGDGTLLLGGSRQAALVSEPEDAAVPRRIAADAAKLIPSVADLPVIGSWWGIRPMTSDGMPIIGSVCDGLVVATGHGSQGVILGGGTARLVADVVTRGEAPAATPFDPGRFEA